MLLLSVTFFYTGLLLSFWSGVYGPSIARTKAFGTAANSYNGKSFIYLLLIIPFSLSSWTTSCYCRHLNYSSMIYQYLLGLHGIFVGVGEIIGGLCFGILGHLLVKYGRDPVVIAGFVSTMVAYFLAFINLPSAAPLGDTTDAAYISSNAYVAIFTSFLLGTVFKTKPYFLRQ